MRSLRVLSRASLLFIALCLVIAPICSARCSLSSCLPATLPAHPSSGCHHHAAPHKTASFAVVATLNCLTSDALLTALPANSIRLLQGSTYKIPATTVPALPVVSSLGSANFDALRSDTSPGALCLCSATPPLRL